MLSAPLKLLGGMESDGALQDDVPRNVAALVLELANTEGTDRSDLLSLSLRLVNAERCAALLWLLDEQWRLLALNRHATNVGDTEIPEKLLDQFAFWSTDSRERDSGGWAVGTAYQPNVREWAERHNFSEHELILPVMMPHRLSDQQPRFAAFLQILSASPFSPRVQGDLEAVCHGIGLLLIRDRDGRRLDAIQKLLLAEQSGERIRDWLVIATDKLIQVTGAEAALMFREAPDGYEAVVARGRQVPKRRVLASAIGVVARVAEQRRPVRLRDFADYRERLLAFGTIEHDLDQQVLLEEDLLNGPIRSVFLAPVVFEGHTLVVIALVNKKASVHLARLFSETDQAILNSVCGFLRGVLPSIELYGALAEMAAVVSPKTLEDRAEAHKVYDVLREMIPAITGVALVRKGRTGLQASIEMFGGELSMLDAYSLLRNINRLEPVSEGSGSCFITRAIPELPEHYLTVELKRTAITGYENQILMFFARALSHILLAEEGREQVIETFAELRHAVRSAITGVVGYVSEARGCFELYREMNYSPSVLSQSRFRKALERADFAAKRSSYLLEESRFLLSHITRESLRRSSHSLPAVVIGVLNTLKPYADERRIEISWNNHLAHADDHADFDRPLVEMMIFNIVENAVKYSYRNRQVHVELGANREHWKLVVRDYGAPILEWDRDIIFQPFTRRPRGQSAEQRPGTGLGLTVARQIAMAHDGSVTLEAIERHADAAEKTFVISMPRTHRRRSE